MSGEANTKMVEPRVEAILKALEMGLTRGAAAATVGIHHSTFYRWLEADATFREAVEIAEKRAVANHLANIVIQAREPKNWTASAWLLERRYPDEFGRRDRVEVTLKAEVSKVAAELGLSEDEVWEELRGILPGTR